MRMIGLVSLLLNSYIFLYSTETHISIKTSPQLLRKILKNGVTTIELHRDTNSS